MKSSDEEIPSTISDSLLSSSTRDIQQLRRKQLAMHFILASTLFERIAFYTISANLVLSLGSDTSLNWSSTNSSVAMLIFSGKSFFPDTSCNTFTVAIEIKLLQTVVSSYTTMSHVQKFCRCT